MKNLNIPVRYGWELILLIIAILTSSFYPVQQEHLTQAILTLLGVVLLVLFLFFTIKYQLNGEILIIKNSIFETTRIPISSITKIEKTWNPISSPAPSILGRIYVHYQNGKRIIISPRDIPEFVNILRKINPDIQFKD